LDSFGVGWDGGETFAVEVVLGGGEEHVVGVAATCDVDVDLGAAGARVDVAGGFVVGEAFDGVAGDGVGVVEADVEAAPDVAVLVEERSGQDDLAEAGEGDGDAVGDEVVGSGVDGGDDTMGAVADVVRGQPGWVEVAVAHAGDDLVAEGESPPAGSGDLDLAQLACSAA
jgi:hypothetical protein